MALGNGERYYSPNYARFIQQDSWLGNNQMPQSLNRFSYGYNNPFKYHDPSGNEPDAVQQGFRDAKQQLANTSTGNWYLDFAANFYLRMAQSGYSAIKGFYNAGKEIVNTIADGVTYIAADAMGIKLKDMKFSSKMAQGIQQQRMSGKSAWDIATDGNVIANVATLGVYGTIQNVTTNILDYSEGRYREDEYNEKMGEIGRRTGFRSGDDGRRQRFGRGACGGRRSQHAENVIPHGDENGRSTQQVKRSIKELTKDFVEGYKGRSRGTYLGTGAGGLQDIYEGVESGVKNVASKRASKAAISELEFVHQLKSNKITNIKDLTEQIEGQVNRMNEIISKEGMTGLKRRILNYSEELEKEGRKYVKTLERPESGKAWLHEPDMATGGLPSDVFRQGDKRLNSIIGKSDRLRKDILKMPNNTNRIMPKITIKEPK